jgi:hypothetical protein
MWDPISLFYMMWVLNTGLPSARLNVVDVINDKENKIFIDTISEQVKLRDGV